MAAPPAPHLEFARRLSVAGASVVVGVTVLRLLVVRRLLLLASAGVLGAVLLHVASTWLAASAPMSRGVALITILLLLVSASVEFWRLLAEQTTELAQRVSEGLATAEAQLAQYP